MTFIKGMVATPWDRYDPVYSVNSCFTQIFEWRTKNTLFVTIFPCGCTEFPEFSMFREISEYSRFVHPVFVQGSHSISVPKLQDFS